MEETFRQRIIDRILKKNFIGAVVCSKDIIPSKIALFDSVSEISISHKSETESILTMDYGAFRLTFHLLWEKRDTNSKTTFFVLRQVS